MYDGSRIQKFDDRTIDVPEYQEIKLDPPKSVHTKKYEPINISDIMHKIENRFCDDMSDDVNEHISENVQYYERGVNPHNTSGVERQNYGSGVSKNYKGDGRVFGSGGSGGGNGGVSGIKLPLNMRIMDQGAVRYDVDIMQDIPLSKIPWKFDTVMPINTNKSIIGEGCDERVLPTLRECVEYEVFANKNFAGANSGDAANAADVCIKDPLVMNVVTNLKGCNLYNIDIRDAYGGVDVNTLIRDNTSHMVWANSSTVNTVVNTLNTFIDEDDIYNSIIVSPVEIDVQSGRTTNAFNVVNTCDNTSHIIKEENVYSISANINSIALVDNASRTITHLKLTKEEVLDIAMSAAKGQVLQFSSDGGVDIKLNKNYRWIAHQTAKNTNTMYIYSNAPQQQTHVKMPYAQSTSHVSFNKGDVGKMSTEAIKLKDAPLKTVVASTSKPDRGGSNSTTSVKLGYRLDTSEYNTRNAHSGACIPKFSYADSKV